MILPLVTAEIFGIGILGRLMGIIVTAGGVAEAASPWMIGPLAQRDGELCKWMLLVDWTCSAWWRGCFGLAERAKSSMTTLPIVRLASLKDVDRLHGHLQSIGVSLPCDREVLKGTESPLRKPLSCGRLQIPNRIAVQPMEGWDGAPDGNATDLTIKRWMRFGRAGAGLIWGGEAVAVSHEGRANPNQLVIADHTKNGLARLRSKLIEEHRLVAADDGLVIGLQLTHSGRFCRANVHHRNEPHIVYHHPILDRRLGLPADDLLFVGSAYTYLQEFLPLVAQAAVREGWVDMVGLGRRVLTYPEILWDATEGTPLKRKRICRTFSDCTTAPRNGLPSGCYPLDSIFKDSPLGEKLDIAKGSSRRKPTSVEQLIN
jgi:hypothetical protein